MVDPDGLILRVCPASGDEAEELAGWLCSELLDLEVQRVDRLPGEAAPSSAKGVADIAGWLLVQLGPETVRVVLAREADWVARNDRVVEVSYGGDNLKLGRAT
jgi:hypothetical protein